MAVAFPVSLPRPQRDGYAYDLTPPLSVSANDRGLGRARRVGTVNKVRMRLVWLFTDAELTTFADWWRTTAVYGTERFTIQLLNGTNDTAQECMAVGPYAYEPAGGRWRVSLPVDIVAMVVATVDQMQDAIDNYDGLLLSDALHQTVHIILPAAITGAA